LLLLPLPLLALAIGLASSLAVPAPPRSARGGELLVRCSCRAGRFSCCCFPSLFEGAPAARLGDAAALGGSGGGAAAGPWSAGFCPCCRCCCSSSRSRSVYLPLLPTPRSQAYRDVRNGSPWLSLPADLKPRLAANKKRERRCQ